LSTKTIFNFFLKKHIPFFLAILLVQNLLVPGCANAQNNNIGWIKKAGGSNDDIAWCSAVDAAGNVYTTGLFYGSADFDPGPAVFNLTSSGGFDIFITKLDANGKFIWAKRIGGIDYDQARSIAIDGAGSIYITGFFYGTSDFDPGPGTYNLTSFGQSDIFICKLDANGNFVWSRQMGGTDYDFGWRVTIDAANNVCSTGEFTSATVDFDPGSGVYNLSSSGAQDVYISKLDANGNFIWAKVVGGTGADQGFSLTLDKVGNIYVTGQFSSAPTDFDPGIAIYNLSSSGGPDVFILKLDANGNFIWAKQMGDINIQQASSIAVDASGNVYSTGYFFGTPDFDPGPGTFTLSASGSNGIFVSKLDANGNFVWAKQMSGPIPASLTNLSNAIVIDAGNNVYTIGYFTNTVDFDPGAGISNLSSFGNADVFISELDANGNFISVKQIGGAGGENGLGMVADANNNIYATGFFSSTADFDPCSGTYNLNSAGGIDFYVIKFAPSSVNITASAATICSGTQVTFTANVINEGLLPFYQWQVNGNNVGTNSASFSTNSLNNNDVVSVILTSNATCNPPSVAVSNKITMTVNSSLPPSVTISTANTTICTGTPVTFTAVALNAGASPIYQWLVNGNNAGSNTATYSSNSLANNDVVKVLITATSTCAVVNTATSNSILMTVNATIAPSLKITASANSICPFTPVTFTAMPANAGSSTSYQWRLNNNNAGSNSLSYTNNNLATGDKINCIMNTVTSCSALPNISSDTITILVYPVPAISITPSAATISLGNSIQLNATINGNYSNYYWTPGVGLNNNTILNPVANPAATTVYKLNVLTAENCTTAKEITVTVTTKIYIPNSFSPDGNGLNDIFRIPPGIIFNLQNLSIYNRYGNLVFKTGDINKGWDGTYKNIRCPAGVYTYLINGSDVKGAVFIKGTLLLIR